VDAWDIAAIAAGYLLGSVDFGVIVPRLLGVDIYGTGSGNPGATNVLRTMGRKEAALVLLGDLAKGVGAAALGSWAGGPVIGFAAGLAGVFQLYLVEAAVNAGASLGRVTIIIVNLLMFAAVGMIADYICQRPLREPVVALAYSIHEVKSAAAEGREPDGMSQRALKVLGDRISRPYKLFSGTNDPNSLISGTVHLDFGSEWALCSVFEGGLGYCDLSEKIFAGRLGCLLEGGTQWACMIRVPEEAQAELEAVSGALGDKPQIRVVGQLGDAVLLDLQGQAGARYRCILRLRGNTVYESCMPVH